MEVFLNGDQPTTCPWCGSRTDFIEYDLNGALAQEHTCLDCGKVFITVDDDEE